MIKRKRYKDREIEETVFIEYLSSRRERERTKLALTDAYKIERFFIITWPRLEPGPCPYMHRG